MKEYLPPEAIALKLAELPDHSGVYIFKDKKGKAIYIGKAVSLCRRVRSYFTPASWTSRPKLAVMMPRVADIDVVITSSEREALLLEANLIAEQMPRYNVALKDDKRYPWLAITYDEPFPRLIMVRDPYKFRQANKASKLFGPYVRTGAMWETVKILRRVFPMRQRKIPLFKDRPCMNYDIGLCLGPCQKLVAEEPYDRMVRQVEMFLSGRQSEVIAGLKREMKVAAARREFERAAAFRDGISSLKRVIEKQQVIFPSRLISLDVLAEAHSERTIAICRLVVRQGKLISSESITLPLTDRTEAEEAFGSFVDQYYTALDDVALPRQIVSAFKLSDSKALAELLSARRGGLVEVVTPSRGEKLRLVRMAAANAHAALRQHAGSDAAEDEAVTAVLAVLKDTLGLRRLPRRIECLDISNLQGSDNVASVITLKSGRPSRSDYRHFKIRGVEGAADDFASMSEVITRRYARLVEQGRPMPDLIIVDGGRGQLNAALAALSMVGISSQDVIGLAKREEEIYLAAAGKPLRLPSSNEALHVLQRARDEAHRFALNYHRKLRAKRSLASRLDGLAGLGRKRKQLLIKHFGSLAKITMATLEELMAVPGLPKPVARSLYESIHRADVPWARDDDLHRQGDAVAGEVRSAPDHLREGPGG